MVNPVTSTNQEAVTLTPPDAMSIVAADRLRQHEKIIRLRALREAAEADQPPGQGKIKARPACS